MPERHRIYVNGVKHRSPGSAVRGAPWVNPHQQFLGRATRAVYRENIAEAETGGRHFAFFLIALRGFFSSAP